MPVSDLGFESLTQRPVPPPNCRGGPCVQFLGKLVPTPSHGRRDPSAEERAALAELNQVAREILDALLAEGYRHIN